MGEIWENRADKNRAHMRNMRLTGMMERTNRNHIQSSAQAQAGAGLAMAAMQTQNHYTADQAEDRALAQLEPSVLAVMPQSSGGVLVNSAFRQQGSARTHVSDYVIGAFQTPSIGVESYRKKIKKTGSMADENAVFRMHWATIVRQMRPAHSGPPVMTSWP